MPSLAQGYGQGLLLGLQLEERKRRMRQDELLDEYRREQIEDIRFQREEKKGLLAQAKKTEEEEAKRREMVGDIAGVEAGGLKSGEEFMKMILGGEETPPETKERLTSIMDYVPGLSSEEQFKGIRVREKVEGAPGAVPWGVSEIGESKIPQAARIALGLEPRAETGLPEWLTGETKTWQKSGEVKDKELREYEKDFGTDWRKYLQSDEYMARQKRVEKGEYLGDPKREFWNTWSEGVPSDLAYPLGLKLGLIEPAERTPIEPEMDITPPGFIEPIGEEGEGEIDYPSLVEGLKAEFGVTHKATLEAHKEGILKQFPNLDWETLKSYFE